jgi:dihydrolipoamide dehydrogenase
VESFDRIVIGAGPGGYVAAIRAAQLGAKVALVDREPVLGGTCLRVGCIPSKVLLESSELYHVARHRLAEHGVVVPQGEVSFDLGTMMARKARVVKELTDGLAVLMRKNRVVVFRGVGRLKADGVVQVTRPAGEAVDRVDGGGIPESPWQGAGAPGSDATVELRAPAIILATGSEPTPMASMPFDGEHIVSSTEALAFERVPTHLLVVGGGAIGLELGSVWCRLGARVTVVEMAPQIVPFADKQIVQLFARALKKQGLELWVSATVEQARLDGNELSVTVRDQAGQASDVRCDKMLIAVGRRPQVARLGLAERGVELEAGGRVKIDQHYRTSVPGIYAIGDLVHGPMLAHKAEDEGMAVAELLGGKAGHVDYDAIPSVVYTAPELAQVGITEEQAKERGLELRVGKFFFKGNGRAKTLGEEDGMVKILADAKTDRLLGVHVLGPRASDLIAEAVVAMAMGASAEDLARTVHAHPTLSEAVKEAALAVDNRAIHG